MYLVVGLGNPGSKYQGTRHNVGFETVSLLASEAGAEFSEKKWKARVAKGRIAGNDVLILEPQTFMHLSGQSVGPALSFYKLGTEALIVVHDEVDLPVGAVKLKKGGGHGGHNGLRSLIQHLPDPEFIRVRIGVGRPPPEWDTADYVLSKPGSEERNEIDDAVKFAAKAIEAVIRDGLSKAMNVANRKDR